MYFLLLPHKQGWFGLGFFAFGLLSAWIGSSRRIACTRPMLLTERVAMSAFRRPGIEPQGLLVVLGDAWPCS